jgi:cell division septal protein FtsQ
MSSRVRVRRASGQARRGRTIRRASAGLSPLRAGALLVMLLCGAATYGVAVSSIFGYRQIVVDDHRFTPTYTVEDVVGLAKGTNLFALSTDRLAGALRSLTTVRDATVSVELPDTVRVSLDEREPVLVWAIGDRRYLVDGEGVLFATLETAPAAAQGLRVVEDRRATSPGLTTGARLDPVDIDAATRLGSLTPADVGSAAARLTIAVDDERGFAVASDPAAWTATFGFYTPTLRTPELVPGQVRLLRSLIARVGEGKIATILLTDTTNGTYTVRDR